MGGQIVDCRVPQSRPLTSGLHWQAQITHHCSLSKTYIKKYSLFNLGHLWNTTDVRGVFIDDKLVVWEINRRNRDGSPSEVMKTPHRQEMVIYHMCKTGVTSISVFAGLHLNLYQLASSKHWLCGAMAECGDRQFVAYLLMYSFYGR